MWRRHSCRRKRAYTGTPGLPGSAGLTAIPGGATQSRRNPRSTDPDRTPAHHHPGPQRAFRKPAGQRRNPDPRRHCLPSHRPRRRHYLSRAGTDRGLSHHGPARMEARRGCLRKGDRASSDRHAGGFRHPGRPHSKAHRRVGGWPQDRRHRRAHQPMGNIARFRAECLHRPALFPVHCSLRTDQTRGFHGAIGMQCQLGRSRGDPGDAFRPCI